MVTMMPAIFLLLREPTHISQPAISSELAEAEALSIWTATSLPTIVNRQLIHTLQVFLTVQRDMKMYNNPVVPTSCDGTTPDPTPTPPEPGKKIDVITVIDYTNHTHDISATMYSAI